MATPAADVASAGEGEGIRHSFEMLQDVLQNQGYFAPVCSARHLSVRFYSWEPSRYIGDGTHMLALVTCIMALLRDSGPDGVSMKTHVLFLLVFTFRFINVFLCEQSVYLVIYKVMLWTSTLKIVMIMGFQGSAKDGRDTTPVLALLFPTTIITLVFGGYSLQDHGLVAEVLWIFSNYLEGLAMLPQYVYCYRDKLNRSALVFCYVLLMGGYRMVFGVTWLYRFVLRQGYLDVSSMLSGFLGIALFADYLKFRATGRSPMASTCIVVDDTIYDAEQVAMEVVRGGSLNAVVFEEDDVRPDVVGRPVQEVELHCMSEPESPRQDRM